MILILSIAIALLIAALFFDDFFEDWSDFKHCLSLPSYEQDGIASYRNDPERNQDDGYEALKTFSYLGLVFGSGLLIFILFSKQYSAGL
jgi:hypothetical protein